MSEPQDPDKSASDQVGASRFWEHYGSARPERSPHAGTDADGHDGGRSDGNGNGAGPKANANSSTEGRKTGAGGNRGHGDPGGAHADGQQCLEWCPVCRGAELIRATVPPELQDQWQSLARDSTAFLKALVDAHLAREQGGPESREPRGDGPIEDIPID